MKLTVMAWTAYAFFFLAIALILTSLDAKTKIVAAQTRGVEEQQRRIAVEAACRVLVEANLVKKCLLTTEGNKSAGRIESQDGRDR